MAGEKIDVELLLIEARLLTAEEGLLPAFSQERVLTHFARLVLADAREIALSHTGSADSSQNETARSIAEEISARLP